MRLPRVTVGRMMALIGAVAVVLAGIIFGGRSLLYSLWARRYTLRARAYVEPAPEWPSPGREAIIRYNAAWRAYDLAMSRKYSDAADRPWLRLEPDPPEPPSDAYKFLPE